MLHITHAQRAHDDKLFGFWTENCVRVPYIGNLCMDMHILIGTIHRLKFSGRSRA